MRTVVILAALLCVSVSFASPEETPRILFIGNSLTGANDLPQIVCRLAEASGRQMTCEAVVVNGYSLADHLQDGNVQKQIASRQWTIVVLQQGPSALDESRVDLRRAVQRFLPLIRAAGARPALFAVWPWRSRSFDFPRVAESYRLAAADVDGLLFPVGTAWLRAWKTEPALPLYGPDDFHPSPAGSYLAALVIYRTIFGEIPPSFADPATAKTALRGNIGLTDDQLKSVFKAAVGFR